MLGEILIICEKVSFMTNSIKKNLEIAGFKVICCTPVAKELDLIKEDLSDRAHILLFLWDSIDKYTEFMSDLKATVLEGTMKLFVVGNPVEKSLVGSYISDSMITSFFERPVNIGHLTAGIIEETDIFGLEQMRKRILVVDDDPVMLRTIKSWLDCDYNVSMVNSAMNAITWLAKNEADLILLDYEMPIISGAKLIEMIREEPATVSLPVIFLTSKGDKASVVDVLKYNPDGYLLKTLQPFEIKNALLEFFKRQDNEEHEDNDIFWEFVNKMSNQETGNGLFV